VFFASETEAIAASFRPCGRCMREQYSRWKLGGTPRTKDYPWHRLPK
jgi:methylphosphotriester-DNA--protein-cysteine methyltransferase